MAIASVRFYFRSADKALEKQLTANHWGFADWFTRRLKPVREALRGPEAKGVNIVNLMLHDDGTHAGALDSWVQLLNTFQCAQVIDLRAFAALPAMENVASLMMRYAQCASFARWPQVRALEPLLLEPLSKVDRITILPFLQWPRGEVISEAKAKRMLSVGEKIAEAGVRR